MMQVRNRRQNSRRRSKRRARAGMSALEVVMTTAVFFPIFATCAYVGIRALRVIFTVVGSMVGSPLL